ncbi:hypothetical protein GP486_006412 [Trichoglossum hirsutum]|uniref:Uncharacterized protein n=1 Tax=Trichoglossum hirsutum TaxID=265104 RepID=A0A9P8IJ52_9PEZI|nr:hypothetical protein GP486_006412 [Trichoglossum hirsutum]
MARFFDNLVEKCAGKSASDRLHQRLVEKQLNEIIESANSVSSVGESNADPAQPRSAPARSQSTPLAAAVPESAEVCSLVRPSLPPRSKSYIPEPARRPRFRREDRSFITLDGLLPDEEYANWYPPESPVTKGNDLTNISMRSSGPSSQNGSDSGLGVPGAPLLYSLPKLPEMVGVGRFRRSKTATDEWFQQNLAKELRAMSPLVRDDFFLRGPPIHPFQDRKGSDASAASSTYGQPVVSENGSIIVRGFVSASSSFTTSGTLENRTQESSWRSDPGNQGITSPHIGYDCSCPDANADARIRPNGFASFSNLTTEIHQSPPTTTSFLRSGKASAVVTNSGAQQSKHRAKMVLGKIQVVARHPIGDLQIEELSLSDYEDVITEDEEDGNSKEAVNGQQARKVKRAHVNRPRVARRFVSSRGVRKTMRPRTK